MSLTAKGGTFTIKGGSWKSHPQASGPTGVLRNWDFDTGNTSQWTSGNGALEAGAAQSPAGHQFAVVSSPTRDGTGYAGYHEMHNNTGDRAAGGNTYRSLWGQYDEQVCGTSGEEVVYGLSLRPGQTDGVQTWELHQRANIYNVNGSLAIAPHAILVRSNQWQYRLMAGSAIWNGSTWTGYANYQDQIPLTASITANVWYDFIVHIRASETNTGFTNVYVRQAGSAWPSTPTWSNTGPSVQFIPGGSDPAVPTKRSTFDTEAGTGYKGLYLECGIYTGSSTWFGNSPITMYQDNLRRYDSVASAKTGFPA